MNKNSKELNQLKVKKVEYLDLDKLKVFRWHSINPTFPRKFNYSHIFYRPMTEIAGGLTHQAIEAEIGHSSSVILLSFYN
jgi:hypothetical protein